MLEETDRSIRELLSVVAAMPPDVKVEVLQARGLDFHLIWIDEERFVPGEFFDHFRDHHRQALEKWLDLERETEKSLGH